jgi:hypothetical protein
MVVRKEEGRREERGLKAREADRKKPLYRSQ